jgi:hypothetical protein
VDVAVEGAAPELHAPLTRRGGSLGWRCRANDESDRKGQGTLHRREPNESPPSLRCQGTRVITGPADREHRVRSARTRALPVGSRFSEARNGL